MLPEVTFALRPDRVAGLGGWRAQGIAATLLPREEAVKVDQALDQGVSLGKCSGHIHPGGNPGAD